MRLPFVNEEGKPLKSNDLYKAAKEQARKNVKQPSLLTMLRRWWTAKYQLPWTHEAFQQSSLFELLTERYEDLFEKDPDAMFEAGRNEDGEVELESDDSLISKWERELAMGLTPDLTEGMHPDAMKQMEATQKKAGRAKQLAEVVETGDILESIMGSSGKVGPIKREDAAFLRDNSMGSERVHTVSGRGVNRRK